MSGKKIGLMISAAVLAIAVLFVADWQLRSNGGWVGNNQKNTQTAQPFLANLVFPSKYQARYRAKEIVDRAEDIESQDERAIMYFRAIDLLKDKDDADIREEYLQRLCDECPDSPQTADAWILRIRQKVSQKPPADPSMEVDALAGLLKRVGIGKDKIADKSVQDTIKALDKPFPNQARKLQSALNDVTPKKPQEAAKKK